MGINKYFRRSYGKRQSSSTSFSSTSFSSTDDNDINDHDPDHDVYAEGSGKRYKRQRRPSWWKWSSSRSSSKRGEGKTKKQNQNKKGNKDEANRNNDGNRDDFNDNENDNDAAGTKKNQPQPPPILPSASPEIQEAVRYFEIVTKDGFTKEFVKKKYKRLSLIHHPDRNGNEEKSLREMQKINHYFELLEEELDRLKEESTSAEKVDGGVDDPPVTPTSNSGGGGENYNANNDEEKNKDKNKYAKSSRRTSHHRRRKSSVFHHRSSTTTGQGCESSHPKKQSQRASSTTRSRKKQRFLEHPIADPLFDIVLCVLVGRYVTYSGWVVSQVIIALAYGATGTATKTQTATVRLSKPLFFALHTGWYLLAGIFSRGKDLIEALGDGIPLPWQLQLVGVATVVSILVERKQHLQRPLCWLANAMVEVESALMVGFDWILLSREKTNILLVYFSTSEYYYVQTIADFVVLSIPILVVRLLLYCC